MKKLPDKYRYRYREEWSRWESIEKNWELIGQKGGLHLHVSDYGTAPDRRMSEQFYAGLEVHYRAPPPGTDRAPDHNHCWLLEAPCWHDGSSMYPREKYVPMLEAGKSNEEIFASLARDADRYFEEKKDE